MKNKLFKLTNFYDKDHNECKHRLNFTIISGPDFYKGNNYVCVEFEDGTFETIDIRQCQLIKEDNASSSHEEWYQILLEDSIVRLHNEDDKLYYNRHSDEDGVRWYEHGEPLIDGNGWKMICDDFCRLEDWYQRLLKCPDLLKLYLLDEYYRPVMQNS